MPKGNQSGSIETHHGRLRIVFSTAGRRIREATGQPPTKEGYRAARALLRRRVAEVEAGAYVEPKTARRAGLTFSAYSAKWIESLGKTREGGDYARTTLVKYRRLLDVWCRHIGDVEMFRLTPEIMEEARVKAVASASQNYSSGLVMIVKKMLRQAEADGAVRPGLASFTRTPLPEKRTLVAGQVWSREEAAKAPALAAEIDQAFGVMVLVALSTGMRLGEVRALRAENVDLDERVIRVRLTAAEDYPKGQAVAGRPKTLSSIRDLDVDERVAEALRQQIARSGSEWVFPYHLDASKPMSYWRMHAMFRKLCDKLGRRLPPHRVRHTFASTAISSGEHLKDIASYMGDTQATIEKVYLTWVDRAAKVAAASRFAKMYDSAPIQPPAEQQAS